MPSTKKKATPKFNVDQVVRINTDYYDTKWKAQQYQRIVAVFPWKAGKGFGYEFANEDVAHEKFLLPLTVTDIIGGRA